MPWESRPEERTSAKSAQARGQCIRTARCGQSSHTMRAWRKVHTVKVWTKQPHSEGGQSSHRMDYWKQEHFTELLIERKHIAFSLEIISQNHFAPRNVAGERNDFAKNIERDGANTQWCKCVVGVAFSADQNWTPFGWLHRFIQIAVVSIRFKI